MRTPLLTLVTFLALSTAAPAAQPPASANPDAAERSKLTGLWKGYTVEGKGENPDRGPVKLELTITDTAIHGIEVKPAQRIDHGQGPYTLSLAPSPRHLDAARSLTPTRKQSYLGIYSLEGDTLKWCVSPQKTRPTTFETEKGQFLLILKRDPSPANPPQ